MKKSGRYLLTSEKCPTCDQLSKSLLISVVEKHFWRFEPRAENYPIHRWYTYVQTYSPEFVKYLIQRENITPGDVIIDPCAGTGTTLVESKLNNINSVGAEVISFLAFVSRVKTKWNINAKEIGSSAQNVLDEAAKLQQKYQRVLQIRTLRNHLERNILEAAETDPKYLSILERKYFSQKPLSKLLALKEAVLNLNSSKEIRDLITFALASIVRPSSNLRFGPEIGLKRKLVEDVDVFGLFRKKISFILEDLEGVQKNPSRASCEVYQIDSRELDKLHIPFEYQKSHMIFSPPYPQDHDYTREVRLELILLDFIETNSDIKDMKKRMIRSSTRGVYSSDKDYSYAERFGEIAEIMRRIDQRVKDTKGTSGFEKLYSKLVGEYFGGMYRLLSSAYDMLTEGGTMSLLVGDSHAFKMVHIETAKLLEKIGLDIGFKKSKIEVWQYLRSTAHDFPINENILTLYK